jgi:peptidyl-prolyl cis-trans isomerase C
MTTALFPDLIVNGEQVDHTLIAAETQNHEAPKGKPGIAWRKAARALVIRTLLLQEAARRELTTEPEEIGPQQLETNEEAQIRGLLDHAISAQVPDEAAIKAEWDRNPTRFRAPPLWEVSHILVACDPRDETEREAALTRATAYNALALETPNSFTKLARHNSDCGSKTNGGTLGQLGPGDTVPEFEAALRTLVQGEISSEPVLTRHGYHVVRLDAFVEGSPLPFEAVRAKIAQALEKAAWVQQAQQFVNQLVEAANIEGADLSII